MLPFKWIQSQKLISTDLIWINIVRLPLISWENIHTMIPIVPDFTGWSKQYSHRNTLNSIIHGSNWIKFRLLELDGFGWVLVCCFENIIHWFFVSHPILLEWTGRFFSHSHSIHRSVIDYLYALKLWFQSLDTRNLVYFKLNVNAFSIIVLEFSKVHLLQWICIKIVAIKYLLLFVFFYHFVYVIWVLNSGMAFDSSI